MASSPTAPDLPDEIEDACKDVAQTDENVLLVGDQASHGLLKQVAQRLHDLADVEWNRYEEISCRGMPSQFASDSKGSVLRQQPTHEWVTVEVGVPSKLERALSFNDTLHLTDVECANDQVAWGIHRLLVVEGGARVVASTTTDPKSWPSTPLFDHLRECRMILVSAPDDTDVAIDAGDGIEHDPHYKWFSLNGKRYPQPNPEESRPIFTVEQSAIVHYMHEQRQRGNDEVSYANLRDAGVLSGKLDDAFRSRPGTWGQDGLLVPGSRKGVVRLRI